MTLSSCSSKLVFLPLVSRNIVNRNVEMFTHGSFLPFNILISSFGSAITFLLSFLCKALCNYIFHKPRNYSFISWPHLGQRPSQAMTLSLQFGQVIIVRCLIMTFSFSDFSLLTSFHPLANTLRICQRKNSLLRIQGTRHQLECQRLMLRHHGKIHWQRRRENRN